MTSIEQQVFLPPNRDRRLLGLGIAATALAGTAIYLCTDIGPDASVALRICAATPLVLGSIAAAVLAVRLAREKVVADGQGIAVHRHDGMRRLRWAKIASIGFANVDADAGEAAGGALLTIHCVNGRVVQFAETRGVPVGRADCEALARVAIRATADRLLRRAVARFEAGRSVTFGRLKVGQDGLSIDGQLLSWRDYGDLRLNEGAVELIRRGSEDPWRSIPTAQLRNDTILRPFLEQVLRLRSGMAMSAPDPWQAVVQGGR